MGVNQQIILELFSIFIVLNSIKLVLGGAGMKRIIISALLIFILIITCVTLAYASFNDMNLQDAIKSFIRYDFKTVKETTDTVKDPKIKNSTSESDVLMTFEPVDVNSGWLYDLAGGGKLGVKVGTLEFNDGALTERYIDIKGENGEVRLLSNSASPGSEYNKTLFWSFKQQDGTSIIKGSTGEVKCAVLFEKYDGSYCLYGYIDGDGTDFWSLELPKRGFYFTDAVKENKAEQKNSMDITSENAANLQGIDKLLSEIMSSPLHSSATGDYIKAHQKEYDEIVSMGEEALPSLIGILNGGDKGLRGNIVMLLCEDIVKNLNENRENNPETEKLIKEALSSVDNWNIMMGYTSLRKDTEPMPEFTKEEVAAARAVVEEYYRAVAAKDAEAILATMYPRERLTMDRVKSGNIQLYGTEKRTLLTIDYDSQDSMRKSYKPGIAAENIIVFKVSFNIEYPLKDGGPWNEGIYNNWSMILIRDGENSPWLIYDQGY